MAKMIEDAYQEMVEEYEQFRKEFGRILEAVSRVQDAEATDDVHGLLEHLEDTVHKVRTGGLLGGGAKGHRAARAEWLELQKPQ